MYKLFLFCGIFLSLMQNNAHAASYEAMMRKCREKMAENPPRISVVVNYGKLQYDFSKNNDDLVRMYKQLNPDKPVIGKMHGLTNVSPSATTDIRVTRQVIGEYYVCTTPADIKINLRYENPTVYILSSLRKGSCPYRLALRHEQTHLDIAFTAMTLLAQIIKEKMPTIIEELGPRITPLSDKSNIAVKLSNEYQSYLMPTFNLFQNTLIEQQELLDTPENYKKESMICR